MTSSCWCWITFILFIKIIGKHHVFSLKICCFVTCSFFILKTLLVFLNLALTWATLFPISLLNISNEMLKYFHELYFDFLHCLFSQWLYFWLCILVCLWRIHIICEFVNIFLFCLFYKILFESIYVTWRTMEPPFRIKITDTDGRILDVTGWEKIL